MLASAQGVGQAVRLSVFCSPEQRSTEAQGGCGRWKTGLRRALVLRFLSTRNGGLLAPAGPGFASPPTAVRHGVEWNCFI